MDCRLIKEHMVIECIKIKNIVMLNMLSIVQLCLWSKLYSLWFYDVCSYQTKGRKLLQIIDACAMESYAINLSHSKLAIRTGEHLFNYTLNT